MSDTQALYKYLSPAGVDLLLNRRIKVTPPNEFNDVFEFQPIIKGTITRRWIRTNLLDKRELRASHKRALAEGVFAGPYDEYAALYAQQAKGPAIRKRAFEILDARRSNWLDAVSKIFGVLCMSTKPDCLLMWGLYADSHRGLAIEFDQAHLSSIVFRPVRYSKTRPTLDLSRIQNNQVLAELGDEALWTKSEAWVHESEWRARVTLPAVVDNQPCYLPVPPQAICSVILGKRSSPSLRAVVKKALGVPDMAHATLFEVDLHASEYRMELRPA